jgi:hypothetical protein
MPGMLKNKIAWVSRYRPQTASSEPMEAAT